MTQIADYVKVPLNTATGIISRLEKRDIVVRMRSPEDKRIVTIELTNEGIQCIKNILQAMTHYGQLFMKCCTMEELQTIFGIAERFFMLLSQENKTVQEEKNDKNTKVRKIQIDQELMKFLWTYMEMDLTPYLHSNTSDTEVFE